MLYIYKIGLNLYNGREDTNGGLYEYDIIREELNFICKNNKDLCNEDILITIGGYLEEEEKNKFIHFISNNSFYKKIFIATDFVAIDTCKEIINMHDYLLTQTTQKIKQGIRFSIKQFYSFVPELFYKYQQKTHISTTKEKIIFGGANTGRQDLFDLYCINENNDLYNLYIKDNKRNIDTRIPYNSFIYELRANKFTLIISREDYRKVGWVTPRYYEAVAANCFPIVDMSYDENCIYNLPNELFVSNYEDVKNIFNIYNKNEKLRSDILYKLNKNAVERKYMFSNLIIDIIKGKY